MMLLSWRSQSAWWTLLLATIALCRADPIDSDGTLKERSDFDVVSFTEHYLHEHLGKWLGLHNVTPNHPYPNTVEDSNDLYIQRPQVSMFNVLLVLMGTNYSPLDDRSSEDVMLDFSIFPRELPSSSWHDVMWSYAIPFAAYEALPYDNNPGRFALRFENSENSKEHLRRLPNRYRDCRLVRRIQELSGALDPPTEVHEHGLPAKTLWKYVPEIDFPDQHEQRKQKTPGPLLSEDAKKLYLRRYLNGFPTVFGRDTAYSSVFSRVIVQEAHLYRRTLHGKVKLRLKHVSKTWGARHVLLSHLHAKLQSAGPGTQSSDQLTNELKHYMQTAATNLYTCELFRIYEFLKGNGDAIAVLKTFSGYTVPAEMHQQVQQIFPTLLLTHFDRWATYHWSQFPDLVEQSLLDAKSVLNQLDFAPSFVLGTYQSPHPLYTPKDGLPLLTSDEAVDAVNDPTLDSYGQRDPLVMYTSRTTRAFDASPPTSDDDSNHYAEADHAEADHANSPGRAAAIEPRPSVGEITSRWRASPTSHSTVPESLLHLRGVARSI